jgi:hypothetical protein
VAADHRPLRGRRDVPGGREVGQRAGHAEHGGQGLGGQEASVAWRTKDTNNSDKRRNWSGVHEHILIYANPGFGFIGPDAGPGKFRLRPGFGDVPVRLDP